MTKREVWQVIVFSIVSCGIYAIYWQYVTTQELKDATGRDDINPMMDLLLTIFLCGIWGIYAQYRNAQVVHEALSARGHRGEDRSQMVLIMHIVSAFTGGATFFVAMAILQDEFNKLATALESGSGSMGGPAPQVF